VQPGLRLFHRDEASFERRALEDEPSFHLLDLRIDAGVALRKRVLLRVEHAVALGEALYEAVQSAREGALAGAEELLHGPEVALERGGERVAVLHLELRGAG